MFLMSGFLSFFTVCSVFLPSSREAADWCQSSVCVLSANEAQPTRRWSCCGATFDLWEALSLRLGCPWRGRGAPHLPQGSGRGQRGEPPSCSFQHQHRPIDRPQEEGGGRGGRREGERRGECLISLSLCFHQPNKAGDYFYEHVL